MVPAFTVCLVAKINWGSPFFESLRPSLCVSVSTLQSIQNFNVNVHVQRERDRVGL